MPNKFLNDTGLALLWNKIRLLLNITANEIKGDFPQSEDDVNVLNLLTEFQFTAPITDADGDLIIDTDGYTVLG